METKDPNSPTPSPSTLETEAYFNSLLKSQEAEKITSGKSPFRPIALFILVLVVGFGLYYSVNFYIGATELKSSLDPTSEEVKKSGAYFTPEYYSNRDRGLFGKVNRNLSSTAEANQAFVLENEEGEILVYLYSENNNLDLSVGLNVEINGQLRKNAPDGKEIIEVTSIKLK